MAFGAGPVCSLQIKESDNSGNSPKSLEIDIKFYGNAARIKSLS